MSYTLYYHSKCEGFTGRGFPALAMCKHAGKEIVVKAPEDAPAGALKTRLVLREVLMICFLGSDLAIDLVFLRSPVCEWQASGLPCPC